MVVTTSLLWFFYPIAGINGLKDRNPKNVAAVIGVNCSFKEYDGFEELSNEKK
jgi:DNA polymerase-3 subunit delta